MQSVDSNEIIICERVQFSSPPLATTIGHRSRWVVSLSPQPIILLLFYVESQVSTIYITYKRTQSSSQCSRVRWEFLWANWIFSEQSSRRLEKDLLYQRHTIINVALSSPRKEKQNCFHFRSIVQRTIVFPFMSKVFKAKQKYIEHVKSSRRNIFTMQSNKCGNRILCKKMVPSPAADTYQWKWVKRSSIKRWNWQTIIAMKFFRLHQIGNRKWSKYHAKIFGCIIFANRIFEISLYVKSVPWCKQLKLKTNLMTKFYVLFCIWNVIVFIEIKNFGVV